MMKIYDFFYLAKSVSSNKKYYVKIIAKMEDFLHIIIYCLITTQPNKKIIKFYHQCSLPNPTPPVLKSIFIFWTMTPNTHAYLQCHNSQKLKSTKYKLQFYGPWNIHRVDRINLATADPQISWGNLSLSIASDISYKSYLDLHLDLDQIYKSFSSRRYTFKSFCINLYTYNIY